MSISVQCPNCDKKLKTKDELAGKKVKCPDCGEVIPVPAAEETDDDKPQKVKTNAKTKKSGTGLVGCLVGSFVLLVLALLVGGTAFAIAFSLGWNPFKTEVALGAKAPPPQVDAGKKSDDAKNAKNKDAKPADKDAKPEEKKAKPPEVGFVTEDEAVEKVNSLNGQVRRLGNVENAIVVFDLQKKLTDADLAYLKSLPKLQRLSLFHTNISDAGMVHVGRLSRLKELILSGTKITDKGLAEIAGLYDLTLLGLSDTKISDDGLKHIAGRSYFALELARTDIGDKGLENLKDLRGILRLQLDGTKITDAGLAHLPQMMSGKVIHDLYLAGTNISDDGLVHLLKMKDLTHLHVEKTKITEAGVAKLKAALPKLKVVTR